MNCGVSSGDKPPGGEVDAQAQSPVQLAGLHEYHDGMPGKGGEGMCRRPGKQEASTLQQRLVQHLAAAAAGRPYAAYSQGRNVDILRLMAAIDRQRRHLLLQLGGG